MNDLSNRRFQETVSAPCPPESSVHPERRSLCLSLLYACSRLAPLPAFLLCQLNKEKQQRRQWAVHSAQKEVFDTNSAEFSQLDSLRDLLEDQCAEPSRTGKSEVSESAKPSRRKQLVTLRNQMRETLKNVDAKIDTDDGVGEERTRESLRTVINYRPPRE